MTLSDTLLQFILLIAVALFMLATAFVSFAIKIIPENKRVVVMRLGKMIGSRGPGLVVLLPIIDFAIWVDLNKTYRLKYGSLVTRDNREISCVISLNIQVTDPEKSVLSVPNLEIALSKIIETESLSLVASKNSSEITQYRDWLEEQLKDVLQRSGRPWGIAVTRLTIDEIGLE